MILWCLLLLMMLWDEAVAQQRNDTLFLPNPFGDTMRDLTDALEAVFLSALVYRINETNYADRVPAPYTPLKWWDSGSTDVLFVIDNSQGRMVVAFRGTDETEDGDWVTNLDIVQDVFGPPEGPIVEGVIYDNAGGVLSGGEIEAWNIRVHQGFNAALFSESFFDVASNILLDYETIWICGHSLGGANAQLFGTYLAYRYPELNIYVTTFGSPRVGNYGFKVWADSLKNLNVWRFVNRRDLVPRSPTTNYDHAGHIMWKEPCEDCDGPVVAHYRQTGDPAQGYDGIGSAGFTASARGNGTITDHYLDGYTEWLQFAEVDPSTNYTCGFQGASETQCPQSSAQYVRLTFRGRDLAVLVVLMSCLLL